MCQIATAYLAEGAVSLAAPNWSDTTGFAAAAQLVINKRAGGMGLISGRKAFQRPMKEGVGLLNAIQDVYLAKDITVA